MLAALIVTVVFMAPADRRVEFARNIGLTLVVLAILALMFGAIAKHSVQP
ncbi:MAG TPA: hypothetical protein VFK89_03700 [Actinomycetota bacterium]|nr:hypothetical protein [Actinomycetota bacterium]